MGAGAAGTVLFFGTVAGVGGVGTGFVVEASATIAVSARVLALGAAEGGAMGAGSAVSAGAADEFGAGRSVSFHTPAPAIPRKATAGTT